MRPIPAASVLVVIASMVAAWALVFAVRAGTLSCTIATSCPTGAVIFRMSSSTNAHAELPSQSNYSQLVCCTGITSIGNDCASTTNAVVLKLSSSTNAHSEQNTQTNYSQSACISVPSGGTVSVGYQSLNCSGFDTTLGSMSSSTNAHVGSSTVYTTQICATATNPGANQPPVTSAVTLNSGNPIVLLPLTTTSVSVAASTTDPNGAGDIRFATSTIFRSGVTNGANCTASDLNCYQLASTSCSFTGSTSTVICTANMQYFAQATDASSSFSGQTWQARVTVTDSVGNTGTASTTAGVTLQTLLAINISPTSINFGSVSSNADTGSVNQTSTIQNAGNSSSTVKVSGTDMLSGGNTLAVANQKYASTTFTFATGGTALSTTPVAISGFLLVGSTSTAGVSGSAFWGLGVPNGTVAGTYGGTNTFTAIWSP